MANDLFQQKYRIDSARLAGYDYGANGMYFVTICTHERERFFGEVIPATALQEAFLKPTAIGQVVIDCWLEIPERFSFALLDAFQLVPNHLHGIVWVDKPVESTWQSNRFGPQQGNLAAVVRGFKAWVSALAKHNQIDFSWQARYHDHIVRNDYELNRIRTYIANNLAHWERDKDNVQGMFM